MDCLFSRITNIHPHPNADKLDLGLVNNWPVVVPKGSFIENEIGLFICPDAKLPNNKVWAEPFLNYTGKENRVRTVKLRGEYSNGIFVKLEDLVSEYSIYDENLMLDIKPEQVAIDLGIGHYSPPLPNDLAVAFPDLPFNLAKTDEENWENIPEYQLLLGQKALVTRKMDGCSATYILTADGEFYCCGRRFTYKNDCFNRYTKVGHEIVRPALEKWVKKYNETIIVRGEITGQGVNGNKVNKDSKGPLKFNLFKTIHPSKNNTIWKWGYYGTQGHFLWCTKVLGLELETVPILGEMTITKDLLLHFQQAPKEDGEGVVIEFEDGTHYKAKSMDYYSSI